MPKVYREHKAARREVATRAAEADTAVGRIHTAMNAYSDAADGPEFGRMLVGQRLRLYRDTEYSFYQDGNGRVRMGRTDTDKSPDRAWMCHEFKWSVRDDKASMTITKENSVKVNRLGTVETVTKQEIESKWRRHDK